jgi:hypothetical protein
LTSPSGFKKVSNLVRLKRPPEFSISKNERESLTKDMITLLSDFEDIKAIEG